MVSVGTIFRNWKIGQGGYGTVFRAKRKIGPIKEWDYKNNQWRRMKIDKDYGNEYVALKTIGNSESLTKDFLNEVIYLLIDWWHDCMIYN